MPSLETTGGYDHYSRRFLLRCVCFALQFFLCCLGFLVFVGNGVRGGKGGLIDHLDQRPLNHLCIAVLFCVALFLLRCNSFFCFLFAVQFGCVAVLFALLFFVLLFFVLQFF